MDGKILGKIFAIFVILAVAGVIEFLIVTDPKKAVFPMIMVAVFALIMISVQIQQIKKTMKAPGGICPECRTRGAKSSFKGVRCPNPQCPRYDASLSMESTLASPASSKPLPSFQGSFDPGDNSIRVQYRNFQGDDRTFTGDSKSLYISPKVVSLRVTPTGQRINLLRKFVQNFSEVERAAPAGSNSDRQPHGVERQILGYHLRKGSTSPRFEEVRKKFPDWMPGKSTRDPNEKFFNPRTGK
jgi:hypothetical protein